MRRGPRDLVLLLVVALAFYAFLIGVGGVSLLADHRWTVRFLGVGVLVLPLVGVVIVANELRFGRAAERLSQLVDGNGAPPADPDAEFELRKADVEATPEDWRAWYRLAVAYGDARDTARARRTMRKAIALERADAPTPPGKPPSRSRSST
jgi:hypothetical protein